jgi:ketosteroid isomerase-like protein
MPTDAASQVEREVRSVLATQARDWNAGDIPAFMQGYARTDTTRFASGGSVVRGWATVMEGYQKHYTNRAAMGHLTFSELEVTVLAPDAAVVFGRWGLVRDKDTPGGLFTLLFRKMPDGWRIVADHTSAAETPK